MSDSNPNNSSLANPGQGSLQVPGASAGESEISVPAEYTIFINFMRSKNEPWTVRIGSIEKDSEMPAQLRVKILEHALEKLKENAIDLYRTSLPLWGLSGAPRYYALITKNWKLYNVVGIRWNMIPTYWALFGGFYWAPAIGAQLVKMLERELSR